MKYTIAYLALQGPWVCLGIALGDSTEAIFLSDIYPLGLMALPRFMMLSNRVTNFSRLEDVSSD